MSQGKIGVGIITYKRPHFFKHCYNSIPWDKIDVAVVVNDGPEYNLGKEGVELNDKTTWIQHEKNMKLSKTKNDAINFLNSAIGSKVISLRTIMIVASLGIFIGAIFSSGMMEVARKGIFNPGEFYFDEIMIIFMAVILTDILLLDFFNTLGLPTSTTVSIVFNLLGASVVMSIFKIISSDSQNFND